MDTNKYRARYQLWESTKLQKKNVKVIMVFESWANKKGLREEGWARTFLERDDVLDQVTSLPNLQFSIFLLLRLTHWCCLNEVKV